MFNQIPFLFIGSTEIIIIIAVVLLLFGGKKIPELMRGIGAGVKSFKDGMREGEAPEKENAEKNVEPKDNDKPAQ